MSSNVIQPSTPASSPHTSRGSSTPPGASPPPTRSVHYMRRSRPIAVDPLIESDVSNAEGCIIIDSDNSLSSAPPLSVEKGKKITKARKARKVEPAPAPSIPAPTSPLPARSPSVESLDELLSEPDSDVDVRMAAVVWPPVPQTPEVVPCAALPSTPQNIIEVLSTPTPPETPFSPSAAHQRAPDPVTPSPSPNLRPQPYPTPSWSPSPVPVPLNAGALLGSRYLMTKRSSGIVWRMGTAGAAGYVWGRRWV